MVKIISALLLAIGSCDLIGYNRLGNNVFARNTHRGTQRLQYGAQLAQKLVEQYGDADWLRETLKSANQKPLRNKFNRRGRYVKRMTQLYH